MVQYLLCVQYEHGYNNQNRFLVSPSYYNLLFMLGRFLEYNGGREGVKTGKDLQQD